MNRLNFSEVREPNKPVEVLLAEDISIWIGLSPSWEKVQHYKGLDFHEKSEKYISQLKKDDEVLSSIWIMRHIPFGDDLQTSLKNVLGRSFWYDKNAFSSCNRSVYRTRALGQRLQWTINSHFESFL